ncbi:hypothetical protein EDD76_103220 [Kineothrix alysoides]|uniref:Uncharacterized protein n=1 Tax=Kineothrix alysoides TaxID=1469948 RepID=A0A4R1R3R5_9FIRM|nr:hypothetical protein [Kineothrix alysoides]TCL60028.1 hypothetical protein EDD76_103220 [Kineothrix alysoides]
MKATDKDKPISTVPSGTWEATPSKQHFKKPGSLTTDLQNNGYPAEPFPGTESPGNKPRED